MSASTWSGRTVTTARAYWRSRLEAEGALPCWRCPHPVTVRDRWQVEHIVPRSAGGDMTDVGNQWVSHGACNESHGGRLGQAARRAARGQSTPAPAQAMTAERARGIRGI